MPGSVGWSAISAPSAAFRLGGLVRWGRGTVALTADNHTPKGDRHVTPATQDRTDHRRYQRHRLCPARRFIAEGARVAITSTDPGRPEQARRTLGDNVLALHTDAGDLVAQRTLHAR
jgi:hypothetical protein